ncbi:MAG TPA: isocitrate lyase/PEP mutase family protein [Acidimicrobiales bacterium]|nr:isocitrate lyase/PEP mutase family protein [Acidimicrobiales bacterium]
MDGDRIRQLLGSGGTVLMPGVWDALSARLVAQAGFDVCFLSGYATAATLLGLPDFGYLTQAEMAEVARRVCRAAPELAVVVDGDTGHGNALNTIRTVELWESAGAAGIFLEDQVWPKKCGHMAGKRVVAREEWLTKLRAAVDHRHRLFVVARTDARAAVGLAEACERARMAADVGVDAVFVEAPESVAELEAVAAATPGLVRVANMIEAGRTPLLTPGELHDLGFDLIVSPLTGLFAAARALSHAYGVLAAEGTLRDHLDIVTSFEQFNAVVDLDRHYQLEARYAVPPQAEADPPPPAGGG